MGNFVPPVGHPVFLTERGYSYQSVALPVFVGPIATLDLSTNDLFEATMPESDVTLVLINPRIAAFRLTLHHAVGVFALTFPTGLFSGQPGPWPTPTAWRPGPRRSRSSTWNSTARSGRSPPYKLRFRGRPPWVSF